MRVAILGAAGFLGRNLVDYFSKAGHDVVPITSTNYESTKDTKYDLFVNSDGNSKRFWANLHPAEDFSASVLSVYHSVF